MSTDKRTILFLTVLVAAIILGVCQRIKAEPVANPESGSGKSKINLGESIGSSKINTSTYSSDKKINISSDINTFQTNMMQYKGSSNDTSITFYMQYANYQLFPLIRGLQTNYNYLIENKQNQKFSIDDRRRTVGGGLDFKINKFVRLRYIVELIDNKLANTNYTQESYGLIYNQYISTEYVDLNNYLETFHIPRVSSSKFDTFAKVQALKAFNVSHTTSSSNTLYPFLQIKTKFNDEANFGLSGQNASIGAGYKYYRVNETQDSFAFVLEGHGIAYQSKDFNGDWVQVLAAVQFWTN